MTAPLITDALVEKALDVLAPRLFPHLEAVSMSTQAYVRDGYRDVTRAALEAVAADLKAQVLDEVLTLSKGVTYEGGYVDTVILPDDVRSLRGAS